VSYSRVGVQPMSELAKDFIFSLCVLLLLFCFRPMREMTKHVYHETSIKNGKAGAIGGCLGLFVFGFAFNWLLARVARLALRDFILWLFH
jgi:hypothetical protein